MDKQNSVYAKLGLIAANMGPLAKLGRGQYANQTIDQVMAAVGAELARDETRLTMTVQVAGITAAMPQIAFSNAQGQARTIQPAVMQLTFRFDDPDTGDYAEFDWSHAFGFGAVGIDQECAAATSSATKDFLKKTFQITDGDGAAVGSHASSQRYAANAASQRYAAPPRSAGQSGSPPSSDDGLCDLISLEVNESPKSDKSPRYYARTADGERLSLWSLRPIAELFGSDQARLEGHLEREGRMDFRAPLRINAYRTEYGLNMAKTGHPEGLDNPAVAELMARRAEAGQS